MRCCFAGAPELQNPFGKLDRYLHPLAGMLYIACSPGLGVGHMAGRFQHVECLRVIEARGCAASLEMLAVCWVCLQVMLWL